jgi:hypothetical protein
VVSEDGPPEFHNLELSEQVKFYFNMAFNTHVSHDDLGE